jgi:hypothetical protein
MGLGTDAAQQKARDRGLGRPGGGGTQPGEGDTDCQAGQSLSPVWKPILPHCSQVRTGPAPRGRKPGMEGAPVRPGTWRVRQEDCESEASLAYPQPPSKIIRSEEN